jgi:predicted TIM-barrel fold metal-dependent hydrolase
MQITDCHAHLYSDDTARYPQIAKPYLPPAGKGTLEHLRQEMAAHGVSRVVAVHTSTAYEWDNALLADTARANAPWMVGVCTLDPDNPASPDLLERHVRDDNVRGMRSVAAGPNHSRLDHPGVEALWARAEELGVPVNPLIHLDLADELEALLRRHRALNVVLDHCMYPRGKDGQEGETTQRVLGLSEHPNLYAKLTWLADSSDRDDPFEDTYPLLRAVIAAYGPERCVWGSDFPCELWTPKANYGRSLELFTQALGLEEATLRIILEETPGRLWFGER